MTNSQFRLESMEEFNILCKDAEFLNWASPVYDYFETMKPGHAITMQTDEKHLPWLIKTACAFILSGNHWKEYEFNDDYTKFRRRIY